MKHRDLNIDGSDDEMMSTQAGYIAVFDGNGVNLNLIFIKNFRFSQ